MANGWSIDPSVFINQVEEDIGKKMRFISLQLLNEIVSRSPVDTGRFRANNQVSIGFPEYSTTDATDKNGAATLQQGSSVIAQGKPYSIIYIQNNLPYAEPLENGHSQQAPVGIYAVSFHGVTQAYK
ncbi:HK97 gp10 family phage protein [Escherichia coli]|uniref:HK97 gp10 family phage protein n=1 Tax=Escherichia coli TaxID=562 RepID=UPI0017D028F1|nr:HK97 gp10 family phage protein [Escherichia coli]EEW2576068.1 HK97 gp10 family phage protein [Escherichia coli]EFC1567112.1 HK97 gp10 family phage protein [Escherichia coli]EFH5841471.1 HK97 gp10 family phage protein [Escherichia coli]EFL9559058.1 HK97 gp10 family phage protein [Escherichia coli]EGM3810748.1 HK97 gp10 family phage protein [Escherichia coli]